MIRKTKPKVRGFQADAVELLRKRRRTVEEVGPSAEWRAVRLDCRGPGRLEKWMKTFLPDLFFLEFSEDQRTVIGKLDNIIHHGGLFAEAMPRGGGKTTIVKAAAAYAWLEGYRRFVVPITADAATATAFIQFFQILLSSNSRIMEAYTPVTGYWRLVDDGKGEKKRVATGYIAHGEGISMRYKSQLRTDGAGSALVWSLNKIVLPSTLPENREAMMVYCSGSIITGKGLTGGFRGLHHNCQDGSVIRPDFVMLDDPQTRESAESTVQTDTREKIICGDVLGLAGPNTRITAAMTCTVVRQGDLAERFLDRERNPQWQGERMSLIYAWPTAQDTLWREYQEIYRQAKRDGSSDSCPAAATEFYRANRAKMDAGAVVASPNRYRDGELSALQYAENQLIDMGPDAFASEMQNAPIKSSSASYEITEDTVIGKLSGLPKFSLSGSHFCAVMVDINRSGLHWVAMSSATEFSGKIAGYGCFKAGRQQLWTDDGSDGIQRKQAIYSALKDLLDELKKTSWTRDGLPALPNLVLIDCGYEMDTVFKFCAWADQMYPFNVAASRGRASRDYRLPQQAKIIGKPGDGYHLTTFSERGKVLVHNSDRWRMEAQKAFLLPPGAPGSISLYGKTPADHRWYAGHICAEILGEHVVTDKGEFFSWQRKPGSPNDLLDATVGAMVGLYRLGCQDAGIAAPQKPQPVKRRTATQKVRSQIL